MGPCIYHNVPPYFEKDRKTYTATVLIHRTVFPMVGKHFHVFINQKEIIVFSPFVGTGTFLLTC